MIIQLRTGGSRKGGSYYKRKRECLRRTQLDEIVEEEMKARGEEKVLGGGSPAAHLGTLMHGILDAYTKHGAFDLDSAVFEPLTHPALSYMMIDKLTREPVIMLAKKLFQWWQTEFPPNYLGQRVSGELDLPQTPEGAARILKRVGHEYTGDLDLVTRLDASQASLLAGTFGADIYPGLWGWDYKVITDASSTTDYVNSGDQHITYPELFYQETGTRLDGFAYVFLIRGRKKTPEPTVYIVNPGKAEEADIEGWIRTIDNIERVDNLLRNPNPALTDFNKGACENIYGDRCPHWESGRCLRR